MRSLSIRTLSLTIIAGVFAASAACSDETQSAGTRTEEAALVRVTPQGGSTNVDPNARIQMEFDHPMVDGVEALCAVHLGGLDGEEVPGAWEWSEDHHVLTFTPHDSLQLDREHTLHVGGGITDRHGHGMDFDQHGLDMGGHWVDEEMLGEHGGMMGGHSHMGDGWQHHSGYYGMAFSFRTTADSAPKVALLRVSPEGGSTNVDPNERIQLEFDHPMVDGVEALCAVHLGGLDGEEVPGAWEWSEDHHVLTFTPHDSLQLDREHTLHVGGGITDRHGHGMDFDQHGLDMGGHWVDEEMLGQHGGMMGGHSHMGDGWQHHNGTYGMAFPFWTAP